MDYVPLSYYIADNLETLFIKIGSNERSSVAIGLALAATFCPVLRERDCFRRKLNRALLIDH